MIRFLRQNPKLLTLLGTVIVFFTFVFKDVLQENARETKNNYNSAASSFTLINVLVGISDRVRHVEAVLEGKLAKYEENAYTLRGLTVLRLEDLESAISNIERVCKTLPKPKICVQLEELKKVRRKVKDLQAEAPQLGSSYSTTTANAYIEFYEEKVKDVQELQKEVKHLSDSILRVLKAEAGKAARHSRFFNWCSVFLYVLGVVVTAAGQLVGVNEKRSASG